MAYDLIGKRSDLCFNNKSWAMLIDLALRYGWKPTGARDPEALEDRSDDNAVQRPRDRLHLMPPMQASEPLAQAVASLIFQSEDPIVNSYFSNSGFKVTRADALGMADAVKRALPDVPNHDAMALKTVEFASAPGERFLPIDVAVNCFEWFSGENKVLLKKFIAFCRKGGFQIW